MAAAVPLDPHTPDFQPHPDALESTQLSVEQDSLHNLSMDMEFSPPRGGWGAGGWQKGAYGKVVWNAKEAAQVREEFRTFLLKKYHSLVGAWRDMDRDGNGRLSFAELCRACHHLGYAGRQRKLWETLDADRSGYVSFDELDEKLAEILGSIAVCVWVACGNVEDAWKKHFSIRGLQRLPLEEFARGCREIGYTGDVAAAFEALCADKASTGLSATEFAFLKLWFAPEAHKKRSPLHEAAEIAMSAKSDQEPAAAPRRGGGGVCLAVPAKQQFKNLLIKTYGNFVRAWREGLDTDHNGLLDYKEFMRACHDVGYAGNPKELWAELDVDKSGGVSLRELDEPTAEQLHMLLVCTLKRHGSWEQAWHTVLDVSGTDRVGRHTFVEGVRVMGYGGNADRLFELLDTDRAKYLTFATTQWIEGSERVDKNPKWEDIDNAGKTGEFRKLTRSQMRKLDFSSRDHRLRLARFASRSRGEIKPVSPSAATTSNPKKERDKSLSFHKGGTVKAQTAAGLLGLDDSAKFSSEGSYTNMHSRSSSLPLQTRHATSLQSPTSDGLANLPTKWRAATSNKLAANEALGARVVPSLSEPNLTNWRKQYAPYV